MTGFKKKTTQHLHFLEHCIPRSRNTINHRNPPSPPSPPIKATGWAGLKSKWWTECTGATWSISLAPCHSPTCSPLTFHLLSDLRETHSHLWTSVHLHSWPWRNPNSHVWKHSLTLPGYSGELRSRFPAPDLSTSWKTKKNQEQTQVSHFIWMPQDDPDQSWRDQCICQSHVCCRF